MAMSLFDPLLDNVNCVVVSKCLPAHLHFWPSFFGCMAYVQHNLPIYTVNAHFDSLAMLFNWLLDNNCNFHSKLTASLLNVINY